MSAPRRSWRFLLTPWWIGVVLTALLFSIACWTVLAPWQFRRYHEREAEIAAVTSAVTANAVAVSELLSLGVPPPTAAKFRPVTATGTFDTDRQVYVRLRQDNGGNPAAEVLVPFRLADGTVVMVDRGYMPDNDVRLGHPPAAPPAGTVTITGRVQPDQPDPRHRAPILDHDLTEVYGIDSQSLGAATGPVRMGFVELGADSPGVLQAIDLPQEDEGPFLSYAWQWCAFGAMALLALGYFTFRELTDPLREDEDGPEPEPAVAATTGSGPRRGAFDKSELYD